MGNNVDLNIIAKFRDQVSRPVEQVERRIDRMARTVKNAIKVMASALAVRESFRLAEMGAVAEQIEKSFSAMAQSVGINGEKLKRALMEASAGTINFSNVASQVSALMAQGLGFDEIVALMRQARAEAKLFGRTTEESFKVIASAITGGLVTTLRRSYGLQLSLEEAVESYAKKIGKTAEEVKKFYMAQAIANHILEKSRAHLEAVNLEVLSNYERIQMLKARWTSFLETVGQWILRLVSIVKSGFEFLLAVINWWLGKLLKGIRLVVLPLEKLFNMMSRWGRVIGDKMAVRFHNWAKAIGEFRDELAQSADVWDQWAQDMLGEGEMDWTLSTKIKETEDDVKRKAKVIADAIKEKTKAMQEDVSDKVKQIKITFQDTTNEIVKMSERASERIQDMLGDHLYQVLSGKVHGIKGLFRSLGNMILQMFSQKLATKLFAWTGIGGVFDKFLGGLFGFQLGTPYIPKTGLYLLHKGERVVPSHEAGGTNVGINVVVNQYIQSWDVQDVWRNRKVLATAISEEIKNNASIRGVLKRYG